VSVVEPLTAGVLAGAMGGRLAGGAGGGPPTGFSIDSRTLAPGELFFAIVARRDGHEFVGDAIGRGACGVVVSRPVPVPVRGPFAIEVADTTRALQDLARYVRRTSGARVVAITGSAGKTTTKDAIAALLEARYRVVKNPGNLNNHLGLPLSLLELRYGAEVAVMELGMNHAGEIRVLVGIAEPEVRVWTNVGEAHIGNFGSPEALADAKAEVLEAASSDTVCVANADDPRVMARARAFAGRLVTFGLGERADVRAVDLDDRGLDGSRATLVSRQGRRQLIVPLVGRGHLANVLAASAVALELGVAIDEVVERVRTLRPAARRGEVVRLANGVVVLDDSYNSSPSALRASIDTLGRIAARRRLAVVGEMLELGDLANRLHEDCGQAAARAGLHTLVTVGGEPARALGEAAVGAGLARAAVSHYATSEQAADAVAAMVRSGDVVLVKGSRRIRTEVVVDRLKAVTG
jgi:UDP-N-acetylmuramoyl-tripeptide--D-alanyl-D-alanine ligase